MEFIFFIFGIFVGSFLNVIVDRTIRDESFWKGRSYCEKCKKNLAWHDLIPLLSYIYLQGKCRYCKTSIGYWYPVIEITTGLLFLITFVFVNMNSSMYQVVSIKYLFDLVFYLFITSSLIVIFFIDLKFGIIPDRIVVPTCILTFFYIVFSSSYLPINHLGSALGACLFFLLLFLGTKGRGMGFGDVKYAFLMGLLLGFPKIVIGLYAAFLSGAFLSLILIVLGKKKLKGSTVPFGPFLVFGTLLVLFWGDELTRIILKYFF